MDKESNSSSSEEYTMYCKACKQTFEFANAIGPLKWIDGWFRFNCPCCKKALKTQHRTFEPALDTSPPENTEELPT